MQSRHSVDAGFSLEGFRRACPACCGGKGRHLCGDQAIRTQDPPPQGDEEPPDPAGIPNDLLAAGDRRQAAQAALRAALHDPDAAPWPMDHPDDPQDGYGYDGILPPPEPGEGM